MYRKHLREQEEMESSKTGSKTIDHISEIPMVNFALSNVTDYYGKMKEKNSILRTSFNLAELSVKTMAFAATPITTICKKPIESVDSYLYAKLHDLEHNYPTIVKPTEQVRATALSQAKMIYTRTVKEPIDALANMKDKTTDLGFRVVDACLENRYTKLFTNPVLDFTEKSLDYLFPLGAVTGENGAIKDLEDKSELETEQNTLRRIYDINSRLYKGTFQQLNRIHFQFETTIQKLQSLKQISDAAMSGSKERLAKTLESVKSNTLVAQCSQLISKNNISPSNLEALTRTYSQAILRDVTQMLEKYMSLVKNFPLVFNGSKLRQTMDNLVNQLNKGSMNVYLSSTIDQLKTIHQALLSYTNQMFQVVNDSKLMQLLKRIQSEEKISKVNQVQSQKQQSNNIKIKPTTPESENQQNEQLNLSATESTTTTHNTESPISSQASLASSPNSVSNVPLTSPLTSPPPPTPIHINTENELSNHSLTVENLNKIITKKLGENLDLADVKDESEATEKSENEKEENSVTNESSAASNSSGEGEENSELITEEESDENEEEDEDAETTNSNTTNDQSQDLDLSNN